jgi:hypothetical protein
LIRYSAGSAGSGHDSQRLCWPDRWWAWEDLNLRPHPEGKIARVSTGSAALRAEFGRACPILIPRGGPRPWGSYQACSSYALFAARARDDQLSRGVHVTVVVRAIPGLAVRCGMRVARPARTNVVRSSWRRHQLACRARPVLSDHLPRWQGPQARGSCCGEGSNPVPCCFAGRGRSGRCRTCIGGGRCNRCIGGTSCRRQRSSLGRPAGQRS